MAYFLNYKICRIFFIVNVEFCRKSKYESCEKNMKMLDYAGKIW